jgi:hypothetical protein
MALCVGDVGVVEAMGSPCLCFLASTHRAPFSLIVDAQPKVDDTYDVWAILVSGSRNLFIFFLENWTWFKIDRDCIV